MRTEGARYIPNDHKKPYLTLHNEILKKFNVEINDSDFKIIKYENTSKINCPGSLIKFISNYTLLHLDEKWFLKFYINNYTDGMIHNDFKNVSDTNSKDEELIRFKINYITSSQNIYDLAIYHIDSDNKYDMWTPDNNGFTTYTDYQGYDKHKTNAISIKKTNPFNSKSNFCFEYCRGYHFVFHCPYTFKKLIKACKAPDRQGQGCEGWRRNGQASGF